MLFFFLDEEKTHNTTGCILKLMPKFYPQLPSWHTLHIQVARCQCMRTFADTHLFWIFNFDPYLLKLFFLKKTKPYDFEFQNQQKPME